MSYLDSIHFGVSFSPNPLNLKMVVVCYSETLESTHNVTGCRDLVDHNVHNL
jgi:hypothetical protein